MIFLDNSKIFKSWRQKSFFSKEDFADLREENWEHEERKGVRMNWGEEKNEEEK